MHGTAAAGYSAAMPRSIGPRERARAALETLSPLWPEAKPLLDYRTPFELVCAVALSAQCTDEQVNRATPGLFARWPTSEAMAAAPLAELELAIHSLGFFRTKARHLVEAARIIESRFGGRVPGTMEELLELPGVGRKTANLVLSAVFGKPGIIVDTHVLRVCLRLGLGERRDPGYMELRIAELLPEGSWTRFSYAVNRHGKYVCTARMPACVAGSSAPPCPLLGICPRVGLA
jgi:endonuclease III